MRKKHESGGGAGVKRLRTGARSKSVTPIGVRVGGRRLIAGCTLNVGSGGALLICTEDVPVGTRMEVTNLRTEEFFMCRVVWRAGLHESGRFGLGVEILNASGNVGASDVGA